MKDLKKKRLYNPPAEIVTDKVDAVINDPEIKVVAHLVGGIEPARAYLLHDPGARLPLLGLERHDAAASRGARRHARGE